METDYKRLSMSLKKNCSLLQRFSWNFRYCDSQNGREMVHVSRQPCVADLRGCAEKIKIFETRRKRRSGGNLVKWANEGNAQLSDQPVALVELLRRSSPSL
jgi:hypothetical protein